MKRGKIALGFLLIPFSLTITSQVSGSARTIRLSFRFPPPTIQRIGSYDQVSIEGVPSLGQVGKPVLPVKSVKVLLPAGFNVDSVQVFHPKMERFGSGYLIKPGQPVIPISFPYRLKPVAPDPKIYASPNQYPAKLYDLVSIQRVCGYRIVLINLYPVVYMPKDRTLLYFPQLELKITTRRSTKALAESERMIRNSPNVQARVKRLVDNPQEIASYHALRRYPQTASLPPSQTTYDYLIITTNDLVPSFQSLADYYNSRGLSAVVRTITGEATPELIRNLITLYYQTFGISYVLLGGDDDLIPHKGFYGSASGWTDYDIPADLYYGCLDGTFDYNQNNIYGEPNDGPDGGEVDLFAEVSVGRACVNTTTEADNFIHKVISYQQQPVWGDVNRALMVGEYLGVGSTVWGGDYKDEVKDSCSTCGFTTAGFPDRFQVTTLYDRDLDPERWDKYTLIPLLNGGVNLVNHLGHSNVSYTMRMVNDDVDTALTNDGISGGYYIVYCQGCYSNAFDNREPPPPYGDGRVHPGTDAISEHFTSGPYGAVAFIGNTRFGWGYMDNTCGPNQLFDRQFFDAIFGEGLVTLGLSFDDSKEDNAAYVSSDEYGAIRWCYYQLCLLGDPAMTVVWGGSNQFIRGDYNSDGVVSTQDPLMELQSIFGVPGAFPASCEDAADYDDDGSILTNDPLMALQFIFGVPKSILPPPPYPNCGIDPTEDNLHCIWHRFCMGGKTVPYKPSVSRLGAMDKLVAGNPVINDGLVQVPVDLTVAESVCGLDISLGYDATTLLFKEVEGGDEYDFWAVDTRQAGVVRIGAVPDIEMAKLLKPGTHRIGKVAFEVKKKGNMGLSWKNVEIYGSKVQPLSVEWVVKAGKSNLPKEFALEQNYPNPFNSTTVIRYSLPGDHSSHTNLKGLAEEGSRATSTIHVLLEVYNILGEKVATLVDEKQAPGYKTITWNAHSMASGIYFCRLRAGDFSSIKKMVLLK